MSTYTRSSDKERLFNPRVTVDLGIKEFKKLAYEYYPKSVANRLIRGFKERQWAMYHDIFPEDNSSVPTHGAHHGE